MNNRKIGIDLIKIIAIIFVPSLHYFLNSGFMDQPYVGIDKIFLVVLRMFSMSCIGLFIAATGYLQCEKVFSMGYVKKIQSYIVIYLIYCFLTSVFLGVLHISSIKQDFLVRVFQFPGYSWYMAFFLGFYLLIPFFNNIFRDYKKEQFEKYLLILILVIAVPEFINSIPSFSNNTDKILYLPNWWKEFFPLLYYSIGAYFRKYEIRIRKIFGFTTAIIFQLLCAVIGYFYAFGKQPIFIGGAYGGLLEVVTVFVIFGCIYDVNIKSRIINDSARFLGKITLNIYLGLVISDIVTWRFVEKTFNIWYSNGSDKLYPIVVLVNFGVAFIIASVVQIMLDIFKILLSRSKMIFKNTESEE